MITASLDQLTNYVQSTLILSSLLTVSAVMWLRYKRPDAERPYRAWGYPATPLLFIAVSVYMLYFQVMNRPIEVLSELVTLGIGLIAYWLTSIHTSPACSTVQQAIEQNVRWSVQRGHPYGDWK